MLKPPLKIRPIVALALVLTAILGSELGLRFGVGLGNPVQIAADNACNYILKPDQDVYRFFKRTRTNHYGMRSDDVPVVRDPRALRIMFVGDSVTYGTSQVDQSDIFTEILHRELPGVVHQPVEVLNASAGAWAIDNEFSYVRSRGIFQADMVVLVLNSGDLTQERSTMAVLGERHLKRTTAWGEVFSLSRQIVLDRLRRIEPPADAGDSVKLNAEPVVRSNLQELDEFESLVTGQHARMVLMYLPFRRDIPGPSGWSDALLSKWAALHGVAFIDLSSAEAPYTAKEITFDGVHLNKVGNRIAAGAIEKAWPSLGMARASPN